MTSISYFRYHNSRMISHEKSRGQTVQNKAGFSVLRLPKVTAPLDSGNYTCEPQNLRPDVVTVHILDGSKESAEETAAAAVQDDEKQIEFHHSGQNSCFFRNDRQMALILSQLCIFVVLKTVLWPISH